LAASQNGRGNRDLLDRVRRFLRGEKGIGVLSSPRRLQLDHDLEARARWLLHRL
jgi:hypothetical protein